MVAEQVATTEIDQHVETAAAAATVLMIHQAMIALEEARQDLFNRMKKHLIKITIRNNARLFGTLNVRSAAFAF